MPGTADVIDVPAEARVAGPPEAPPPADPTPPSVDVTSNTPPPTAALAAAGVPAPTPSMPVQATAQPQVVTVQHKGGLAGLVQEIWDALSPKTRTEIHTDPQGNKTVVPVDQTAGQRWMQFAAQTARGAAGGYAAGQGPGGGGRAATAGFQVGDLAQQQRQKQQRDQETEVRQNKEDQFNDVKRKLEIAGDEFKLKRMGVEANDHDFEHSQKVNEYEKTLGSVDMGIHADPFSDVAALVKQDPNFWKDYHDNRIMNWPEIGPDGKRLGVHVWLRTSKPGDIIVPAGTEIHRFVPPAKPGDQPTVRTEKTTGPMSGAAYDANEMDVTAKRQAFTAEDKKDQMTDAELADKKNAINVQNAQIQRDRAETSKAWAEGRKADAEGRKADAEAKLETIANGGGGGGAESPLDTLANMMRRNDLAPSQLKAKLAGGKSGLTPMMVIARADVLDKAAGGVGYKPEDGEINYQNKQKVVHEYGPAGEAGRDIASFDKFLAHSLDASNAVAKAGNNHQPWLDAPLNKIRVKTDWNNSPEFIDFAAKLQIARNEYNQFQAGKYAVKADEAKATNAIIDENATPRQVDAALTAFAQTATDRLRSLDFEHRRATRSSGNPDGEHVAMPLSPEGEQSLKHFGIDPNAVYSGGPPKGGKIIVTASDGSQHPFDTQAEADNFRRLAAEAEARAKQANIP